MANLKYTNSKGASLLSFAAIVLYARTAVAQGARDNCRPAPVIPLTTSEPPAKIVIDPPLAQPPIITFLSRFEVPRLLLDRLLRFSISI
jgi:hypothetical protein